MNEDDFRKHLRRGGRSASAADRVIKLTREFEVFLKRSRAKDPEGTELADLQAYVEHLEDSGAGSAKAALWALGYYFNFVGMDSLSQAARELRQQRIQRKPMALKNFRGADEDAVGALASHGIFDVQAMLAAGSTPAARQRLASSTGLPLSAIEELVKLSDLARIPGLKSIRARLYYDAGFDTLEALKDWEPEVLREKLQTFVERAQFEGVAPLLGEVRFTIRCAQELPQVVEWGPSTAGTPRPCN